MISVPGLAAWRVQVLRARYGIPLERVYAHNWIDFKDARIEKSGRKLLHDVGVH
ncbi:hypothetical protein [Bradyrhizobium septentrionale]|uniref:N-acetylmuramoyl-L-alanine amidase domain-containing protein n=1 Tax=Bradyrhizobium septentrionale TaxID=1404411 RepID=A0A973VVT3_9BRAD|nr:hypothetical protein [Bradyrhizobium septentrionale]UGY20886.1 hypothetical protein HAP48_0022935 [Bradyrhizobium septentrionale]UGY29932.1 hypothetical protein HU675_0019930 [Bradyrhizobium septentrionale]